MESHCFMQEYVLFGIADRRQMAKSRYASDSDRKAEEY